MAASMKPTVFLTLVTLTACSDDATLSSTSAELTVVSHDCNAEAGYELDSYTPGTGGINIVGVFEPTNPDGPSCQTCLDDPTCDWGTVCYSPRPMTVHLSGGAKTWVLTAGLPVAWTITADPDAAVERIVLSGSGETTAVAPPGIAVEIPEAFIGAGWDWYTDEELAAICAADPTLACDEHTDWANPAVWFEEMQSRNAVANAENYLGDKLGAFYGCESMSQITFGSP
jgi:hypothetical protein